MLTRISLTVKEKQHLEEGTLAAKSRFSMGRKQKTNKQIKKKTKTKNPKTFHCVNKYPNKLSGWVQQTHAPTEVVKRLSVVAMVEGKKGFLDTRGTCMVWFICFT